MSLSKVDSSVRFHLSLNVSNLSKSVEFFQKVFGTEPAKCRPDYAKFECDNPPLVLSLEPRAPQADGTLNHVGFRLKDSATLVEFQRRLEIAGVPSQREEGVECCYSRQTKFWLRDPDQTLWEFYVLEEDIDHRGAGRSQESLASTQSNSTTSTMPSAVWEHRMNAPFDPPASGAFDEVRLRGTFNVPLTDSQAQAALTAVSHVLKPGGRLVVHVLTSETPIDAAKLDLPGPAAAVKSIPVQGLLLAQLREAGFEDMKLETLRPQPCFIRDGVELRETLVTCRKPAGAATAFRFVIYRGPFSQLISDSDQIFRRGERTKVSVETWNWIQSSGCANQFVCIAETAPHAACSDS